jgi:MFS family permease
MTDLVEKENGTNRFLFLYALAWAGASIAYIPFLTILLPVRVTGLVGQEEAVSWLAYIAFAGALAASIGHIGFGYLSDITGNRRHWIWAGLLLSSFLLIAVPKAGSLSSLVALIMCWQLSLNMMLAPLAAMAGDRVPDARKGLLGGLMAFAPGLGALSGALVTIPGLASDNARLGLVAALVALCVVPVLITGGQEQRTKMADLSMATDDLDTTEVSLESRRSAMWRMWLARLTVQIGEAALFAFLYQSHCKRVQRHPDPVRAACFGHRTLGRQALQANFAIGHLCGNFSNRFDRHGFGTKYSSCHWQLCSIWHR